MTDRMISATTVCTCTCDTMCTVVSTRRFVDTRVILISMINRAINSPPCFGEHHSKSTSAGQTELLPIPVGRLLRLSPDLEIFPFRSLPTTERARYSSDNTTHPTSFSKMTSLMYRLLLLLPCVSAFLSQPLLSRMTDQSQATTGLFMGGGSGYATSLEGKKACVD